MRCDLHVHTRHSGMCHVPILNKVCRECYSDPYEVYETLKRHGMDLVTITDHDSIDAAEALRHHADFFLSEEVTATLPSGGNCHIGVYGIQERHHTILQQRRDDLPALVAYLDEQRLFFCINHVFSSLTGRRRLADFAFFQHCFPGVETRNGAMLASSNEAASTWAKQAGKAPVGGSDAHTLASLGRVFTEVAGAQDSRQFLAGLHEGRGRVQGRHGSYLALTETVMCIGTDMMYDNVWTCSLAPLLGLVPLVTGFQFLRDLAFSRYWQARSRAVVPESDLLARTS